MADSMKFRSEFRRVFFWKRKKENFDIFQRLVYFAKKVGILRNREHKYCSIVRNNRIRNYANFLKFSNHNSDDVIG